MFAYILRRLLLVIPTLFGIMILNFVIVQAAPGGPVEQVLAQIKGTATSATARVSGPQSDTGVTGNESARGSRGLEPELIAELERQFGFDKPPVERFFKMMGDTLALILARASFVIAAWLSWSSTSCPSRSLWGSGPPCSCI